MTTIARSPLTEALLAVLAATGKAVGDGVRPLGDAGWLGEPNSPGSTFRPYLVLATLSAASSSGSFGDPQSQWRVPYLVQSFGASRQQCEWMADTARAQLQELAHADLDLGGVSWRVQQVWHESIGAISRIDVTDPPYWGQQDQATVWLTRGS